LRGDHGNDHAPQPRAPPDRRARDAPAPARPAGRPERDLGRRGQRHQGPDGGDAGPGADRRRLRGAGGRRMSALAEILSPDFLLRDALFGSILVGLVCPLVGAYFVLRRMIFLGVALPQLSAAGIASAFVAFQFLVGPHEHGQVSERALAMAGSFAFTLGGLLVLAAFERQGKETVEARIGVTYAVAAALTILFLAADPHGDAQMVNLLKGDILATTSASLGVLAAVLGAVVVVLFAFRKEFLLVSFDRDLAVVFRKRVAVWDLLLYLAIGVELLWMRSAGLVLGATATTTSTVLACYFTGLGLGAALGRRTSTGGVRRYAFLELGAAAGGLWSLLVFRSALATSMLALAMLPATLCLGATLP